MSLDINSPDMNTALKPENVMRRLVIATLLIILVVLVAFVVTGLAVGELRNITIVLSIFVIGALTIALFGNPLPGQIVAPFGVMLGLLFTAYYGDGLHDEILVGSAIAILLAGLLLGNLGTTVISIFLVIGIVVIGLIEIGGTELSPASGLTGYDDIFVESILVFAMAFVQYLLVNRMNKSLEEARRNSDAQSRSNRELRILQASLENRVNERTQQLNRRAAQLQASSEVGRAVSSISDLNELLNNVTTLISERFSYYHVGVFLLDRAGENAILRASNSPGGRQMIEKGHSLPVGSKSIVGYVTQHRDPRIAVDVGRDATFFNNPDLPQTRSEMALPLIAAGQLLGALDVQSSEAAAYTQDDVSVLQVLADQVAIAIENSNLFAESRAALEASRRAYGDLSRQDWIRRLKSRKDIGYQVDSYGNLFPVEGGWTEELIRARSSKQSVRLDNMTLAIPFNVSDLSVGVVKLRKQPGARDWTEREISITEAVIGSLGEALESARLYENTQKRAERERLAADISSSIRENLDVDAVLRTAAIQIRQALNLANVEVRLESADLGEQSQQRDESSMSTGQGVLPEVKSVHGIDGGNGKKSAPKGRSE